jgi:hypothetical protein
MKTNLLTFTLAIALLGVACNNSHKEEVASFDFDKTCWFDGYEYFVGSADTTDANLFCFAGGTLHEGGSTFALRQVAVDTFIIQPIAGETWVAVGVEGDTAVLVRKGNLAMIVCHRPDDPECDTLWQYLPGNKTPMEAYRDLLITSRLGDLAGTYVDSVGKMTYQFVDSLLIRTPANCKADTQSFHFFYSFEMPSHLLILSNNEEIWYEKTSQGLDLFKAKYIAAVEDYTREKPFANLVKQQ